MTSDYVVNSPAQTMPNAAFAELMAAVLARGTPFRFQASGFSMFPFIRDGDVLTIVTPPARLRVGNVAAFNSPCNQKLTVHRVVEVNATGYLLRGDNIPEPDGTVSHAEIIGRVIRIERRNRPVGFGLGIERIMIAFLSRRGWLIPLLVPIQRLYHFFFKRFKA
jgi:signal peptidase I